MRKLSNHSVAGRPGRRKLTRVRELRPDVGTIPDAVSLILVYTPSMLHLKRAVGTLLTLVLFQLVLVESGYACLMPNAGSANAPMAGMVMPGMAMTGMAMPDGAGEPATTQSEQERAPCQFPWAPAGCQAMAPCAPSALTVASATIASFTPARVALPQLVVLAPPPIARAPELPPPRA